MNKRKIAILAGLMTIGAVSFAHVVNNSKYNTKSLLLNTGGLLPSLNNTFGISDRVRFSENRMELDGNFILSPDNRLEMRVRNYAYAGPTFLSKRPSGHNGTTANTQVRMRLYTSTPWQHIQVRTELQTRAGADGKSGQSLKIQPSYLVGYSKNFLSKVLVGFGALRQHDNSSANGDTTMTYGLLTAWRNAYTVNNWLELEANAYYDYSFAGKNQVPGYKKNRLAIEAYVYTNYTFAENKDWKFAGLLEGGVDGYNIYNTHLNNMHFRDTSKNDSLSYVTYIQPSIKLTRTLSDTNSAYLQVGYYVERNAQTLDRHYDKSGFVTVGFTSTF